MKLTWYGTAALLLQDGETAIAFDPFFGLSVPISHRRMELPADARDFRNIRHIFVTHGHLDHIYQIPQLCENASHRIYCTDAPARTLKKHGVLPEQIHRIIPGDQLTIGDFQIRAFQGRHCVFDRPLLCHTICSRRFFRHPIHLIRLLKIYLTHRECGEILFYEVTCRGLRIQIMGSMNLDKDTIYPTGADVLILPLQGRSDQDTYALTLVERLKPRSIWIDHYDNTFPPLSDQVDPSGFIRNVTEIFGISCEPLPYKKGVFFHEPE
jgi:hypothetical protein